MKKILVARYKVEGPREWKLGEKAKREGSKLVKMLCKLNNDVERVGEAFHNGIKLLGGRGNMVLFLSNKWLEGEVIDVFPRLYRAIAKKEAMVSDYYKVIGGIVVIVFKRNWRGFEMRDYGNLRSFLTESHIFIRKEGSKNLDWQFGWGIFSQSCLTDCLCGKIRF